MTDDAGTETVRGTVRGGHKEDAIELPFAPGDRWRLARVDIASGRSGWPVVAQLAGHRFTSRVVRRSQRYWLLLPPEVEQLAGIGVGSEIEVVVGSG